MQKGMMNASIEEQMNSAAMPEIAESVASREEEDDFNYQINERIA